MRSFELKKCGSWLLAASAVLTLAACGGGSGGEGMSVTGSASFSFPLPGGEIVGTSTAVLGTATGDVDEVLVNGIAATSVDGFKHWRASVPLMSNSTSIEIVARAQGIEVDRSTRNVNSQKVPLAHIDDVSPEINGVYVAWTSSLSAVTRIDTASDARSRVVLPAGLGGATVYEITDVEFDPGRNEAILLETSQDPQFIIVDFDNSSVTSIPFPPYGGETLREIEYDDVGDRLILKTEVTPPIALGTPNRIWTLNRGSLALIPVSDESSPGAMSHLNLRTISWERTTGKLYAVSASTGDILDIDLANGSRSVVFDLQTSTGPSVPYSTGSLLAVANPLRFCFLSTGPGTYAATPFLYDVATSTRVLVTGGAALPMNSIVVAQASGNDIHMVVNGRTIHRVLVSGQLSLENDFRIGEGYGEYGHWLHPTFDNLRRRLVGGNYNTMSDFDPLTGVMTTIPDSVAPLTGFASYSDTAYYEPASDKIVFASSFGISLLPAGGGGRIQALALPDSNLGIPARDDLNQCYWWAWRDYYGANSHFKVSRYSINGGETQTVDSQLSIATYQRYGFDLDAGKVYCVGTNSGVAQLAEFDLATGASTILGTENDGGPSLSSARTILKIPGEDRLLVITDDGLMSVNMVSNTRVLLEDFSENPAAIVSLVGMTYDERDGVLYLTSYIPTPSILAYDLDTGTMQFLAR